MAGIAGLILLAMGVFAVVAGVNTENAAESAFHQIFAAIQYTGGMTIAALGCILMAVNGVIQRLKSIDETLKMGRIEAETERATVLDPAELAVGRRKD